MLYRMYKGIGAKISQLGFGCMRFDMDKEGKVLRLKATRLLRSAVRAGINYFDTAYTYRDGESEEVLGTALKPFRENVIISTKNLVRKTDTQKIWMERLDVSVKRLQGPPDILSFHGLNWKRFQNQLKPKRKGLLATARKAQDQGLFTHLAMSCHDTPDNIIKLIDTGEFVGVTLQYNLLDRQNEKVIEHAYKKGLGVVVMGPVGGGRLGVPSKRLQNMVPGGVRSTTEIALRFVLSNPLITTAISGMSVMRMLSENVTIANMRRPLSPLEKRKVRSALRQIEKLSQLYCTGCGYCMPCPHKVNIPRNFELMNLYRVWGLRKFAKRQYSKLQDAQSSGLQAGKCKACGLCVPKCPQNIHIIVQLREVAATLGS